MRQKKLLDSTVLAVLFAAWIVSFGLCLRSFSRGTPIMPARVAFAGTSEYPILIAMAPWAGSEGTRLRLGDRLIQIGTEDLRGVGPLGFYARVMAQTDRGKPFPRVIYERGGVRGDAVLPTPIWGPVPLLVSLGFIAVALLLWFRAQGSPIARSVSRAFVVCAIATAAPITGSEVSLNLAGLAAAGVGWSLVFPLFLRALMRFTASEPAASPWARTWPWLFAATGPLAVSTWSGFPIPQPFGIPLTLIDLIAFLVTVLVLVTRAYRRTNAIGRRQIRWAALGFYAGLIPPIAITASAAVYSLTLADWRVFQPLVWPSYSFAVLIPISFLIAIIRYNVVDVDRLLSATASYNLLLVVLVALGFVLVPRVGELSSVLVGFDSRIGQAAASLLLAAVVVPAHRRIRPWIDRTVFKERYALEQGIADLLRSLSGCDSARALTQRVGEELVRLLQPEPCVLYTRAAEAFVPVFAAGRGIPPAFAADSPLVATLRGRKDPLALSAAGRRPDHAELGPFDRAALEALGAEVVVPVHREETLLAFLCFGPKRSGDVYTSTDLSHLSAVAQAVSSEIRRYDERQTLRQVQETRDALRRYVPGAVAEQLDAGVELGSAQRVVTVLFVDIRGYSTFSESRPPEEIFSVVNRYTETVSEIVRKHGGAVVEFSGDGMMVVFGAPRELPDKERAAVEAGCEIAAAVDALRVGTDAGSLSVGVGIATGKAYVGNIRAADRMIWSAIGNTTNLAARLQGLTRELGATLVIDAATWRAIGLGGEVFERHEAVPIRGRQQPEDVYSLPFERVRS